MLVEIGLQSEEIPHRLFDRVFGARDQGWTNRKRSILYAAQQDAKLLGRNLPTAAARWTITEEEAPRS